MALLTLAGFLAVLALLAWQLQPTAAARPRRLTVVRRVYETRVIETVVGAPGQQAGTSVTQSVSGSAVPIAAAAPTTRTS